MSSTVARKYLQIWPGVRTVVEVTSTVTTPEGAASSVRHYISDEDHPRAAYYAMLARGCLLLEAAFP